MDEEEKPKSFKVDDRRRFSPEGELKPEFRGGESSGTEPNAATGAGSSADTKSAFAAQSGGAAQAGQRRAHETGPAAEITFDTFLVGLSTQALLHLGDIADPQTGQPQQDLIAAQQLIDIIGMLREKTRGNLDRDEEQLIETILFELRMKYVERARHP